MPSISSISIDLHVKCQFYKKWNKKKSTIFFSHYHMVSGGTNGYIIANILSQGAVIFLFKCPQFTGVNDKRRHFLLLAITSYLLKLCIYKKKKKSVSGLNFIQVLFFGFLFLFFIFWFFFVLFCFVCLFVFVFCITWFLWYKSCE